MPSKYCEFNNCWIHSQFMCDMCSNGCCFYHGYIQLVLVNGSPSFRLQLCTQCNDIYEDKHQPSQ